MEERAEERLEGKKLGVVDYDSVRYRRHPGAMTAMVLGIVGIVTSVAGVGIFPGMVALGLGIWVRYWIMREPHLYSGLGYAQAGGWLGAVACILSMVCVLMLSPDGSRPLANRSYCAANVRGIMNSMNVYAAENGGVMPVLPYAPYRLNNSGVLSGTVAGASMEDAVRSMYGGSGAQDGSPLGAVWLLVLKNYTLPKQYICKEDPYVTVSAGEVGSASGGWHVNFQSEQQLSYSFAYPYGKDGKVGAWWKQTEDSTLPLMSDMAPLNGTGKPVRVVAPGAVPTDSKTWNSGNHGGSGQNVGFADGHAEFVRRPDIGQGNDNIFTVSRVKGVSAFGGTQPGKGAIGIETEGGPFDVVMVPADLDKGGF